MMLKFDEWLHDEPVRELDPGARMSSIPAKGICARRVAFVGLVAGSLLLLPVPAGAATQRAKPVLASSGPADSSVSRSDASARTRVSPYVLANRHRTGASRATHSPAESLSVRRRQQAGGRGKQQ